MAWANCSSIREEEFKIAYILSILLVTQPVPLTMGWDYNAGRWRFRFLLAPNMHILNIQRRFWGRQWFWWDVLEEVFSSLLVFSVSSRGLLLYFSSSRVFSGVFSGNLSSREIYLTKNLYIAVFLEMTLQLNPDVNPFQRIFVRDIRRFDELERKLRQFSRLKRLILPKIHFFLFLSPLFLNFSLSPYFFLFFISHFLTFFSLSHPFRLFSVFLLYSFYSVIL